MLTDPRLSVSDRLAMLGSRDLLGRAYEAIHRRELNAGKATEILAQLTQAREYGASAEAADDIVKPLLQYYSVLSYTRAYLLLKDPRLRETALATGHGLSPIGWRDLRASGGDWLDARLRIDSGTFTQLATITKNTNVIDLPHADGLRRHIPVQGPDSYTPGLEFPVRAILARLPSLENLFEAITGAPAACWWCRLFDMTSSLEVEVSGNRLGLPTVARARELFALDASTVVEEKEIAVSGWGPTRHLAFRLPSVDDPAIASHLSHMSSSGASPYLAEPVAPGLRLSAVSLLFAAAYALGMLVRYYPSHWMSYLARAQGDGTLPLIKATSHAVSGFERVIIDSL